MEYDGSIWQIHSESVKSRGAYGATVCAMADRIRELEALAARDVSVCGACHGDGEVSEHECCGQSTSGECCGNSVEVRVPCLFCGNKALAAATRVRVLDEWRVATKNGKVATDAMSEADAKKKCEWLNTAAAWANHAPFRVVRMAMVEEPAALEVPRDQ